MIDRALRSYIDKIRAALDPYQVQVHTEHGEVFILVTAHRIVGVLRKLKEDQSTAFHQLMDVCAVDYPARKPRFDVAYQLLSLSHNTRLTVVLRIEEGMQVPSVTEVYPSANWFEREVFDLFGIYFSGHPDLRRILTDYGFEGHPLRKDFPLSGRVQVFYDDLNQRVSYEPVALEEPFRDFKTASRWQGMTSVQQRDRREGDE